MIKEEKNIWDRIIIYYKMLMKDVSWILILYFIILIFSVKPGVRYLSCNSYTNICSLILSNINNKEE